MPEEVKQIDLEDADYDNRPAKIQYEGKTLIRRTGTGSKHQIDREVKYLQLSEPGKTIIVAKVASYVIYAER